VRRGGLTVLVATGGLVGAAAVFLARAPTAAEPPPALEPAGAQAVPDPVRPAFTVATPRPLSSAAARWKWAPVRRAVVARRRPGVTAPALTVLSATTPEGTTNIVLLLGSRLRRDRLWVHVRLPMLPNNTTGWVPRDALGGYAVVSTHLVVDLERLRATLFRDGRAVFHAPVGVGRPEWPTPKGTFYIRNQLTLASTFYGPVAFGTSARSAVLTDWPAGGYVGIHGTNEPELVPGYVSHGCIRMRNDDILRLAKLMPVGTPLTVR
jgi:lipoprotein-anchoring transpeptidase ErfK/SrfK